MGFLQGPLTVRCYKVDGDPPEGFRIVYPDALSSHAFQEPISKAYKEEVVGWVVTQNLLDTHFDRVETWLFNQYAFFSMRVDKKTLPARYVKALLEKRVQAWCQETHAKACPRDVKADLKDALELELLSKTLPRVQVTECVWNMAEGTVWFHSTSEKANERFRKLFHETFGLVLEADNPLDWVDEQVAEALAGSGGSDLTVTGVHP
jgi:DNA recombination-dependent growth factor C